MCLHFPLKYHLLLSALCLSAKKIASFSVMHKLQDRNPQMWSREYKARGQGQGHKKTEAKYRNARGQGPRTQAQIFCQKKGLQKTF